jgi:hypothetical protein
MHFSRLDGFMTEQQLQSTHVGSAFEDSTRERIAKSMWMRMDAGEFTESLNDVLKPSDSRREQAGSAVKDVVRVRRGKPSKFSNDIRLQLHLNGRIRFGSSQRHVPGVPVDRSATKPGRVRDAQAGVEQYQDHASRTLLIADSVNMLSDTQPATGRDKCSNFIISEGHRGQRFSERWAKFFRGVHYHPAARLAEFAKPAQRFDLLTQCCWLGGSRVFIGTEPAAARFSKERKLINCDRVNLCARHEFNQMFQCAAIALQCRGSNVTGTAIRQESVRTILNSSGSGLNSDSGLAAFQPAQHFGGHTLVGSVECSTDRSAVRQHAAYPYRTRTECVGHRIVGTSFQVSAVEGQHPTDSINSSPSCTRAVYVGFGRQLMYQWDQYFSIGVGRGD